MCKKKAILIATVLVTIHCTAAMGTTIYVDTNTPDNNDGSSWDKAYKYLQDALGDARANGDVDEIRVAAGTYRPDRSTADPNGTGDRNASFQLVNLVAIYGGFPSGGDPNWNDRDPNNKTVLSGDLLGNDRLGVNPEDLVNDPCRADNSYHVVCSSNCGPPTILDMLIIRAGNADGTDSDSDGGGMYNQGNASPTLTDCNFIENAAKDDGGGMYSTGLFSDPNLTRCTFIRNATYNGGAVYVVSNSEPKLSDCTFTENFAEYGAGIHNNGGYPRLNRCVVSKNSVGRDGGGMYNADHSDARLTKCHFVENSASYYGGGMYNSQSSSNLFLIDCVFNKNTASRDGGGIYNGPASPTLNNCMFCGNAATYDGGGMYNSLSSQPSLTNCVFSFNSASGKAYSCGGGIFNLGTFSSPMLHNCTFYGNYAQDSGGGIYNHGSQCEPKLANCILWSNKDTGGVNQDESAQIYGGTVTVTYTCIQGCSTYCADPCNHNMPADPLFEDPLGPDYLPGTPDDNLRLSDGSPCIDAADDTNVPQDTADLDADGNTAERIPFDMDSMPRFFDDTDIPDTGVSDPPDYNEIVDMGAYEHLNPSGGTCGDYFHPYPAYDFNRDCWVNLIDFAFFADDWLECSAPECD